MAHKLTSVLVGDSVEINCNKAQNAAYPVSWMHRPVGAKDPIDIYHGGNYIKDYKADYKVIENNGAGQYSLLIKNVKPGYAGAYFCKDNDPYSTTDSAELVVIGK